MGLTAQEKRLAEAMATRASRMLADLAELVRMPTGCGWVPGLEAARAWMRSRLEALGACSELVPGDPAPSWLADLVPPAHVPPTLICRHDSGRGRPLLVCGHLDTVHDPQGAFRELHVRGDGQTATGPGCADMKGGLVLALHALEVLAEVGVPLRWTVVLNSDEETGSYHSASTLAREAERVARAGGAGLVVEPALPDGSLVIERPGSGQFMIEVLGRAAHVGRDFARGVSAITALAECLIRIPALVDLTRGRILSVGLIRGGTATNVVPDRAWAWGNVRFPTSEDGAELCAALEAMATDASALPRLVVRCVQQRPAKPATDAVHELARLAQAVAADLGQILPLGRTGGVCDGNNLQAAGLPTLDTLGVRGGGLHTSEEWVEIPSLVERGQLLAVLLARLGT